MSITRWTHISAAVHHVPWKKCGSLRNIKRSKEKVLGPCNGMPGSVQRRHRYTRSNAIYRNIMKFSFDDHQTRTETILEQREGRRNEEKICPTFPSIVDDPSTFPVSPPSFPHPLYFSLTPLCCPFLRKWRDSFYEAA